MSRSLAFCFAVAAASPAWAARVDYATYGGHEYAFINEWMTWEQADAACASRGAHLAVVDDLDELRFLLRSVHAGPRYNSGNDSWVGATRLGPFANEYQPGLIFTYPWDLTVNTAFWYRTSEYSRNKTICELF
ncbi:MAG TPA: C-type lectin domain-containing protein [Myxococcota bacterium]|nr:C-type lectin domain-containing protein [Myxococcota bacterium]